VGPVGMALSAANLEMWFVITQVFFYILIAHPASWKLPYRASFQYVWSYALNLKPLDLFPLSALYSAILIF
jgi:hypothetical protein